MIKLMDMELLNEVMVTLAHNKRRTLLTAFGVFWGVFMLVVMLSAGRGIQNGIMGQMESVPKNMCISWTQNTTVPYAGFRKGRNWEIKEDDITAMKSKLECLKVISPVVSGRSVNVVCGDKSGSYRISGVAGNYTLVAPVKINAGRYINDMDVAERRKVVVLGQKIVDEVFKGVNPIGRYVMVGGISYQCVGVSESASNSLNFGGREEDMVKMPYTLVQQIYNMGTDVHMVAMIVNDRVPIKSAEAQVRELLYSRHAISPDDESALNIMNLDQFLQIFRALVMGINMLIWIVGMGTLLSGAIGVSNIVMITVKERTTEIGVRRAIGAKPFDIMRQILSESLVITMISGVIGLVCGVATMYFVDKFKLMSFGSDHFMLIDPMINFNTAIAAFAVIVVIGLLAGIMPAARALKIKAIDAIREE